MRRATLRRIMRIAASSAALLLCLAPLHAADDFFSETAAPVKAKAKPRTKTVVSQSSTPGYAQPVAAKKKTIVKIPIKEVTEASYVTKNGDNRNLWNAGMGPLVPHTKFPRNCAICHVAKRWDMLRTDFHFNHLKETGYALVGAHASVSCLRCHNDRVPLSEKNGRACTMCHTDPHKGTLGTTCLTCHNQTQWSAPGDQGDKVAMHSRYLFPLTGFHTTIDCKQCHIKAEGGDFKGLSPDCYSCHQADFSRGPGHVAQNYSHDCTGCHNTAQWPPQAGNFDHSKLPKPVVCASCHEAKYQAARPTSASNHVLNNFPQTCESCHNTSTWGPGTAMQHGAVGTATCITCHQADYNTAPNHVALTFNTDCLKCHTGTVTWLNATFDHSTLGANPDCYSCHKTEYTAAAKTPASNHVANSFPTTCASCHNTTAFSGTVMAGNVNMHTTVAAIDCYVCHAGEFKTSKATPAGDHAGNGFPTTAGACKTCHVTAAAAFVTWTMPTANMKHSVVVGIACYSCHSGEYTAAKTTPASSHAANGFPTTSPSCQTCHTAAAASFTAWGPGVVMQHSQVTSMACYSCHKGEFITGGNTPASKHITNQFPTTSPACQTCHVGAATSFAAWSGATMDHTSVGGSAAVCWNCHQGDYAAALSLGAPDHVANQFSQACLSCHVDTSSWLNAAGGFDHSKRLPSQLCYGCHAANYNSATKTPASNHVTNGFPQNDSCQICHSLAVSGGYVTWAGTTMNHSQVSSVACYACHAGEFNATKPTAALTHQGKFPTTSPACQNCHVQAAASFASWNPGLMGVAGHQAVAGTACYTCHQTEYGTATKTPASNHNTNAFPTTSPACQTCHSLAVSGGYVSWAGVVMTGSSADHALVTTLACSNCHTGDFNATKPTAASLHNGRFPTTSPACQNCHTTAAASFSTWAGVVMTGSASDHSQVSTIACYTCHTGEFTGSNMTPASKHSSNGFPTTSPACQTCHSLAASNYTAWSGVLMTGSAADHSVVGGTSAMCQNCHINEFNNATAMGAPANINHSQFPTTGCAGCHGLTTNWSDWLGAAVNHTGIATACYTCHQAEFIAAKPLADENHVANNFPTTSPACENCHTLAATVKSGATPTQSLWVTTMNHASVGGSAATCQTCHTTNFNTATTPVSHTQFPISSCNKCHQDTTVWTNWIHLSGCASSCSAGPTCGKYHESAKSCTDCHAGGNYTTAPNCNLCHYHQNQSATYYLNNLDCRGN